MTEAASVLFVTPQNWMPYGDPSRGVYRFDVEPVAEALAARAYWFAARIDYRRRDGTL